MSSGGALAGSLMFNIVHAYVLELNIMEQCPIPHRGTHGLNGWGSYGKVGYCFWKICLKNTGLLGSTLSGHHMTMGFGPQPVMCCS